MDPIAHLRNSSNHKTHCILAYDRRTKTKNRVPTTDRSHNQEFRHNHLVGGNKAGNSVELMPWEDRAQMPEVP